MKLKRPFMYARLILIISALLILTGCYSKSLRHLASDASLIKVGESTRQDVLRYLGEPDGHRTVAPGVEEYVYAEEVRDAAQRTPMLGSWLEADAHETLIVTLTGDRVTGVEFRTYRKDDSEWADDFTWNELK